MAEKALVFVHKGMDVENQWERAVVALEQMSNLEIAMVWRRLSESVPADDFKTHSEYKCLFKRAVREAEHHDTRRCELYGFGSTRDKKDCGFFNDTYCDVGLEPSLHFEYDRNSIGSSIRYNRGDSGFSGTSSFKERDRDRPYELFLKAVVKYGMNVSMGEETLIKPLPDEDITSEQIEEYCESLICVLADNGMSEESKQKIIKKINSVNRPQ